MKTKLLPLLTLIAFVLATFAIYACAGRSDYSGSPAVAAEPQTYTCPMHPEVLQNKPGKCPKCGMDLVVKKESGKPKATQQPPGQYMIKGGKVVSLAGKPMTGCVMMKGGKMMLVEAGNIMPMKKTLTMPDGTRCMVNGVCVMKSGQTINLQEGEMLDYVHKLFRAKGLTLPGEYFR